MAQLLNCVLTQNFSLFYKSQNRVLAKIQFVKEKGLIVFVHKSSIDRIQRQLLDSCDLFDNEINIDWLVKHNVKFMFNLFCEYRM